MGLPVGVHVVTTPGQESRPLVPFRNECNNARVLGGRGAQTAVQDAPLREVQGPMLRSLLGPRSSSSH
eukprot:3795723-Alexandrium_andersonii.AAC.1